MAITSMDIDRDTLTSTIVAEFPVPRSRLWDAYVDPRHLERFWGPPSWPATFYRHDVRPGGRSEYFMTGPEGERAGGYWEFLTVEHLESFEVLDGFTHDDGSTNQEMPTVRMRFDFQDRGGDCRLIITTTFDSAQELDQLIAMGMQEGTSQAMGQIDDVVTDGAAFEAPRTTQLRLVGDTQARITRLFDMNIDDLWRAHHDPGVMRQWLLGPDGWVLTVCEIGQRPGDSYRYEWEVETGEHPGFGFTGTLLESDAPYREVTTEQLIGVEGPGTTNEMQLVEVSNGTLLTIVVTYPNTELRQEVLETGMVDGMEASYARLEQLFHEAPA